MKRKGKRFKCDYELHTTCGCVRVIENQSPYAPWTFSVPVCVTPLYPGYSTRRVFEKEHSSGKLVSKNHAVVRFFETHTTEPIEQVRKMLNRERKRIMALIGIKKRKKS